jgi:DNA modification methylase
MSVSIYYEDDAVTLHHGDALTVLRELPDGSVDSCVTSPPYFGLRDYGVAGQIGAEETPAAFVDALVAVFEEAWRVLADDGTLWLNLGDSYAGQGGGGRGAGSMLQGRKHGSAQESSNLRRRKPGVTIPEKNLLGMPWRVAFALQDAGWILRNEVIWHKPNAMPESVTDRLSTRHEHLFLLTKSPRYWFDLDPVREPLLRPEATSEGIVFGGNARTVGSRRGAVYAADPDRGRNPGDVWSIPTQPFAGAHFAVFPLAIPERCILVGCKPGGTVLDPFSGSGTTGLAAAKHGRKYVGIDLNADYLKLSLETRLQQATLDFGEAS